LADAKADFESAISAARLNGVSDYGLEAKYALCLARLGERENALAAALRAEAGHRCPHVGLAEFYFEIEDSEHALRHAKAGLSWASAEPGPFAFEPAIRTCQGILVALGEPTIEVPKPIHAPLERFQFEGAMNIMLDEVAARL